MMAGDPLVNENLLMQMIHPDNEIDLPTLTNTFYVALCNCFARKVEMEFFGEALEIAVKAFNLEATMLCGAQMYKILRAWDPDNEPTLVVEGLEAAGKKMNVLRQQMHDKLELVAQCPSSTDKLS